MAQSQGHHGSEQRPYARRRSLPIMDLMARIFDILGSWFYSSSRFGVGRSSLPESGRRKLRLRRLMGGSWNWGTQSWSGIVVKSLRGT